MFVVILVGVGIAVGVAVYRRVQWTLSRQAALAKPRAFHRAMEQFEMRELEEKKQMSEGAGGRGEDMEVCEGAAKVVQLATVPATATGSERGGVLANAMQHAARQTDDLATLEGGWAAGVAVDGRPISEQPADAAYPAYSLVCVRIRHLHSFHALQSHHISCICHLMQILLFLNLLHQAIITNHLVNALRVLHT